MSEQERPTLAEVEEWHRIYDEVYLETGDPAEAERVADLSGGLPGSGRDTARLLRDTLKGYSL